MTSFHVSIGVSRAVYVCLAILCFALALTLSAQAPRTESKSGIVRQLSEVRFRRVRVPTVCSSSSKMVT